MSSIARKVKREAAILKRKEQRAALKDTAVREMYDQQLMAGYARGYTTGGRQAMEALLKDLQQNGILSDEQFTQYQEKIHHAEPIPKEPADGTN